MTSQARNATNMYFVVFTTRAEDAEFFPRCMEWWNADAV